MKTFKKLISFFNQKEKIQLGLLVFFTFIGTVIEAFGIGMIVPLIVTIKNPGLIEKNKFLNWAYRIFQMDSLLEFILWFSGGLVVLFLLKNTYLSFLAYFENRFITRKQASLSGQIFEQYMRKPYVFHLMHNTAEAQNKTIIQVFIACSKVILPFFTLFSEFFILGILVAMLMILELQTTLLVITLIGLLSFTFLRFLQKKMVALGKSQVTLSEEMIKWVNQGFSGIKDIKVFKCEPYFIGKFTDKAKLYCDNLRFFQTVNKLPAYFIETLAITTLFLIVLAGYVQERSMDHIMSTLMLFAVSSFRLMPSISRITGSFNQLRYHLPAINTVYEEIALLNSGVSDDGNLSQKTGSRISFNKEITLNQVCYQYPSADKPSLTNVSLTIPKGNALAFVGQSGAGKSTLIDLILGLLKPSSGEILVDGQNINDNISGWRHIIGYVPQTVYFCDDTLRKNIAFGIPEDQIDEKRVAYAIEAAQLQEVIERLPLKLNTTVGERAIRLSGGERQRLGIARALYYNPQILVMDEATSSLDYEIEREIGKVIEKLKGKVTIILIAHRLSAVKMCDEIYGISMGKLQGKLNFDDLAKAATSY